MKLWKYEWYIPCLGALTSGKRKLQNSTRKKDSDRGQQAVLERGMDGQCGPEGKGVGSGDRLAGFERYCPGQVM